MFNNINDSVLIICETNLKMYIQSTKHIVQIYISQRSDKYSTVNYINKSQYI